MSAVTVAVLVGFLCCALAIRVVALRQDQARPPGSADQRVRVRVRSSGFGDA
ncbi:hypothetical protein [Nocardia sp. NPDC048505]|uniref:hypothetical protein n=1 Tax=unclassified Nocardia TaxID=2637762 RepID=UPI0033E0B51C